jgi:hypothetical protein
MTRPGGEPHGYFADREIQAALNPARRTIRHRTSQPSTHQRQN